jgi:two-component system sensor histidine kinase and response regulator WspE
MNADESLAEIFRGELQEQASRLSLLVVALDTSADKGALEPLMRITHSVKGGARAVGFEPLVALTHAMEDGFTDAASGRIELVRPLIDAFLAAIDLLAELSRCRAAEMPRWLEAEAERLARATARFAAFAPGADAAPELAAIAVERSTHADAADDYVRVGVEAMARLVGTAGEVYVESQHLADALREVPALRRSFRHLADAVAALGRGVGRDPALAELAQDARAQVVAFGAAIAAADEAIEARGAHLAEASERLYDQALASRMRPFRDSVHGLPRLVHSATRDLGKSARLLIHGERTLVDRDVLAALEALLAHLVNNAVDHGLEPPAERVAAGKPEQGVIQVEARHAGGMVDIAVTDDGRGIDVERVRARAIERGLAEPAVAGALSAEELHGFLFLPGFTTLGKASWYSGRGVGLDAVKTAVERLGGTVALSSVRGRSTTIRLRLPVTRSVVRALLVVVGGETWGVPLQQIDRIARADPAERLQLEGRAFLHLDEENLALVSAADLLEVVERPGSPALEVVVLRRGTERLGLVVERLIGEEDVVVQPLDRRLGPIPHVASGAVLRDGTPTLVLDVEDLTRAGIRLLAGAASGADPAVPHGARRVLVVDDSPTVRELQRRVLRAGGLDVDVAIDGMDAWSQLAQGEFALLVTDLDMPRLGGLDLLRLVRQSPRLAALPVVVMSYKEAPEERAAAIAAGANEFLGKSSFAEDKLLAIVRALLR